MINILGGTKILSARGSIPPPPKGTTINDLGGGGRRKFPGTPSLKIFSPRQSLSKFIFSLTRSLKIYFFSRRVPLEIYFFLESASQNLFFPGECLSKFIFSRRRASEIIFFSISSGPTPRSLLVVPLVALDATSCLDLPFPSGIFDLSKFCYLCTNSCSTIMQRMMIAIPHRLQWAQYGSRQPCTAKHQHSASNVGDVLVPLVIILVTQWSNHFQAFHD